MFSLFTETASSLQKSNSRREEAQAHLLLRNLFLTLLLIFVIRILFLYCILNL